MKEIVLYFGKTFLRCYLEKCKYGAYIINTDSKLSMGILNKGTKLKFIREGAYEVKEG